MLAAGRKVEVTGRGLEGIHLQVQAPTDQAVNLGQLKGDAVGIFAGTLKHSGLAQATAVSVEGGKVVLKGQASAEIAGTTTAQKGALGGTVHATANKVMLKSGAIIDASGANGGGEVGIYNAAGRVDTKGHPFFEAIGTNGRACVTCHQPSDGMSLSLKSIRERWEKTGGRDPLFAAIDGQNCPNLPHDDPRSHSLLLERGLFRIGLPWPPKKPDGSRIDPEFTIEVVRDPTGCNLDPQYGLASSKPTVSVYRRPRPSANTKYTTHQNFGVLPFIGHTPVVVVAALLLRVNLPVAVLATRLPKRHRDTPRFAVIGYGKLGGKELGYASDLDIIFLFDDDAAAAPVPEQLGRCRRRIERGSQQRCPCRQDGRAQHPCEPHGLKLPQNFMPGAGPANEKKSL